jgi:hypothetical protein
VGSGSSTQSQSVEKFSTAKISSLSQGKKKGRKAQKGLNNIILRDLDSRKFGAEPKEGGEDDEVDG